MPTLQATIATLTLAAVAAAQEQVSFPTEDGGMIYADLYGKGDRAVLLLHGGRFNKGSWQPQAKTLAAAGFRVLAIDFRGRGQSRGPGQTDILSAPLYQDALAAIRYLRGNGAKTISMIGGSMGGGAAADASSKTSPGEIDKIVMLAAWVRESQHMKGRKLFITCRDDIGPGDKPRLPDIRASYERAPEPKEFVILECSAHAQFIFETDQADRLMREILRFLNQP